MSKTGGIKVSEEIGRTKSGKLLRIYNDKKEFKLEVGGEIKQSFTSRKEAIREGKVLMLKSWLPETDEKTIREMLKSYLTVDYNFMLEWCERQAEGKHECDCGCWGYPVEMGFLWSWKINRYRGCPQCGEKIKKQT